MGVTGDQLDFFHHHTTHDFFDNGVFVGEITINLPHAELRRFGYLCHAGTVKTVLTKTQSGGGDDLVAAGAYARVFTALLGGKHGSPGVSLSLIVNDHSQL